MGSGETDARDDGIWLWPIGSDATDIRGDEDCGLLVGVRMIADRADGLSMGVANGGAEPPLGGRYS